MYILGIWDGHDSGACILEDGKILVAINEERLSRRKLEIGFPKRSINECLKYLNLKARDIDMIAVSTSDLSKTVERIAPSLKEKYYLFRRRKLGKKPKFENLRRKVKYTITKYSDIFNLGENLSKIIIKKHLKNMGFVNQKIYILDHHASHAASAIFTSGFDRSIVITLDGVGDGLSGSVNIFENGELSRISSIPASDSLGIFFEQVTNLLGYRELEDEGKVMALANYSYPIPEDKNPFIKLFSVNGLKIKAKYGPNKMYNYISNVVWRNPRERVAYMAQKTLEKYATMLFENAISYTGIKNICWSGGLASNIKLNMKIRHLNSLNNWFVFPHMGDGGLAVGAALYAYYKEFGLRPTKLKDIYWGPSYDVDNEIQNISMNKKSISYEYISDIEKYASELISRGNYLLWYRGRMEYGPRALGNRSILSSAMDLKAKNKLNVYVKQREWYQPFCPTILGDDSNKIIKDIKGYDRFMTMGYYLKEEYSDLFKAISNVDNSIRPQMLFEENESYKKLLSNIKKETGYGIILNTSFNIHGYPIVNSPSDAIQTMEKTKSKYMVMENYLIELNN